MSPKVADLHRFYADPDSSFHLNAVPDPIFHFNVTWTRILIKMKRRCDYWSTNPPRLLFEPPRLHCKHLWFSMALL
jgi:hypothetical protein